MATTVVNVRSFPLVDGKRVLPEGVMYIGRAVPRVGLKASLWLNPFRPGDVWKDWDGERRMSVADAITRYAIQLDFWTAKEPDLLDPVRGKALACWCAPKRCHGDVIVEWIEAHPLAPVAGEPIIFGLHRQPESAAETADAWPSRTAFRRSFDERHRRGMRKAAAR